MQEISDWLRKLGMSEYAQRFAENSIDDVNVLRLLTDQDLKDIGVPLGHRRKMLAAIAGLGGSVLAAPQPALTQRKPQDAAERRQLTVMFCDLMGSTALSARLDPEDMREVIGAYQAACAAVMPIYAGFIAKFMGDGILAYFGYPRAHEDDAERAVRAGLDIIAAVARLKTSVGEPLKVRVGIATGLVVVGDLIGEGASQEQAVVGDTPNLAARLQALAEPGTVVVAASTRRLLGDLFHLRDLGRHEVKGLAEPVAAWAVEGASASDSRFESVRAFRLTGLVGREDEINFLLEHRRTAWQGEGQIVLLSGEPGIGKSPDDRVIFSERTIGMSPTALQVWFHRHYAALGFVGASSHSGRRTFVAKLAKKIVEAGGSLRDVQELAGHASLTTTQRFIQGSNDAKRRVMGLI